MSLFFTTFTLREQQYKCHDKWQLTGFLSETETASLRGHWHWQGPSRSHLSKKKRSHLSLLNNWWPLGIWIQCCHTCQFFKGSHKFARGVECPDFLTQPFTGNIFYCKSFFSPQPQLLLTTPQQNLQVTSGLRMQTGFNL